MKELTLDELCNLLDAAFDDDDKLVSLTFSLDGIYCNLSPCDMIRKEDKVIIRLRDPKVANDIELYTSDITYIFDVSNDERDSFYVSTAKGCAMTFTIVTF